MSNTRFLSSGVYGCIYYPSYNSEGNELNVNKNRNNPIIYNDMVTKLVKNDNTSKTEIEIGKLLKNYKDDFNIVSMYKNITIQNIEKSSMKPQCKLLESSSWKKNNYILLYSKYLESVELSDYLNNNITPKLLINIFVSLCKKINILINNGIIHHDLHFGNILINKYNKVYVIDFGLSIIKKNCYINKSILNYEFLKKIIFHYSPSWKYWTLEYHLLCFLIHNNSSTTLTRENIKNTIEEYLIKHTIIKQIGKEFIAKYIIFAFNYFSKYINKDKDYIIKELFNTCYTWDYYKIALHYLDMYFDIKMNDLPFYFILLLMIHPDPNYRPNSLYINKLLTIYINQLNQFNLNKKLDKQLSKRISKNLVASIKTSLKKHI